MTECEKRLNRIKNQLTKIHDKIQTRVEYLCEDLQDTVQHRFKNHEKSKSHMYLCDGTNDFVANGSIHKELNTLVPKRSTSLDNLKVPGSPIDSFRKIKSSSKAFVKHLLHKKHFHKSTENDFVSRNLSASAMSLLETDVFTRDIPIILTAEYDNKNALPPSISTDLLSNDTVNYMVESKTLEDEELSESDVSNISDLSARFVVV